jgi:uncharacterized protein (DUF1015 family)
VAQIKPFRALRPAPEHAKQVSCVPYDVADDAEVRGFIQDNPLSFLRVTRPEAEFAAAPNKGHAVAFHEAKETLQDFVDRGVLIAETEPCIYIYRLSTGDLQQTGVVACASLAEYEQGLIKKHEKTRPEKVADRTAHMLAVRAQTGLILLAFRATDEIRTLIAAATRTEPLYDFECLAGTRQTVWRISETDAMVNAFRNLPSMYVADGHHRLESAVQARDAIGEMEESDQQGDHNFVLAGMFPAEELHILAYNRFVTDLNGLDPGEFVERLGESFVIIGEGAAVAEYHGLFSVYVEGRWLPLKFAVNYLVEPDPIERLDVTILERYILAPVLGITDPRTDARLGFVGGARGLSELERLVDSGKAAVAFALYPTTMDDLFAVSDAGEIMPPKSTWFEPKLKDGLFVHKI